MKNDERENASSKKYERKKEMAKHPTQSNTFNHIKLALDETIVKTKCKV